MNALNQFQYLSSVDSVNSEEIIQRSFLHIVRDEPQLGAGPAVLVICSNKAEDVVMSEHAGLVHLHLPHPRCLIERGEYFNSNITASPDPSLNFAKAPLPNTLLEADLPGNCALKQEWQPRS